jgi:predicted nucleic-acid-binding protein
MAARATHSLRDEDALLLVDLVVAETVYVLESFYEAPRATIGESLRSLLAMASVIVVDPPLLRAIDAYESERIDVAEAISHCERKDHRSSQSCFVRQIS